LAGNETGPADGGVTGGVTGGVAGGVTGGVSGGVTGGVTGGVSGGVTGGVTGGVSGGVTGAAGAAQAANARPRTSNIPINTVTNLCVLFVIVPPLINYLPRDILHPAYFLNIINLLTVWQAFGDSRP
jgi:hypothetical protein